MSAPLPQASDETFAGSGEILGMSALQIAGAIGAGEVSSAEVTRLFLERIERFNPRLTAFCNVTARRALRAARKADKARARGRASGIFHGVPTAIKDLAPTAGIRTRFGSRSYAYFLPPINGVVVPRLMAGGFVSLGKLATSEFGVLPVTEPDIHAPTRNPWDPNRTPGGSSGGSGAAVAAGMLPIAQGSDGGGSVRIPAAFCHLYGFKPSLAETGNLHGPVNRLGISVMGPLAHTVADAAAMLDVMAGRPAPGTDDDSCYAAVHRPPKAQRIRLCVDSPVGSVDPRLVAATRQTAAVLESLGHQIEEVPMISVTLEEFLPVWQYQVANIPAISERLVMPITRWLRKDGRAVSFDHASSVRRTLAERIETTLFGDADMLLSPTVPMVPPPIAAFDLPDPAEGFATSAEIGGFTAGFNLTTGPAASLPLGLTEDGLPLGVQIGSHVGRDRDVFAVSRQLEEALPWRQRRAPGYGP